MYTINFLVSITLLFLSWNTISSKDYKRFGVNYSNTIGIYSLSNNLSDEQDIVGLIERVNLSYSTDFELRHIFHKTKVIFKLGYSTYNLIESEEINKLNSVDFQIGFGDDYALNDSFIFFFFAGAQYSYVYNASINSSLRTANGIPFISTGIYYNIYNGLELKAELQSGLFSNRLLGFYTKL